MDPLIRRHEAVKATMARFEGKTLKLGTNDCARMAAFYLKKLGLSIPLAKAPRYSSEAGARRALKSLGAETMADLVDAAGLVRIAPLAALPGDILAIPSDHDTGALYIALDLKRAFGLRDNTFQAVEVHMVDTAWRAI